MKIVMEFDDFGDMMEFVKHQAPLLEMKKPYPYLPPAPSSIEFTPVSGSSLSITAQQKLMAAGINWIEPLLEMDDEYLLWQKHLDGDTIRELREWKPAT